MINQKVDLRRDFQPCPINPPVDENVEEVNRACDKLITELSSIHLRILALQEKTPCHGPSIDADRFVEKAIQRLQHQKR